MAIMRVGEFQVASDDLTIRRYQRVILKQLQQGKNLFFQGAGTRGEDDSEETAFVVNIGPSSDLGFHYDSLHVPLLNVDDPLANYFTGQVEAVGMLLSGGIDMDDDLLKKAPAED
ncbi:hypothetical protein [Arthrobacter sp. HLT1-20]